MNNHMTYAEAERLVKEVRESGCFIDEYCKRMGIPRKRYYNAIVKLKNGGIDVDSRYPKAPRIPEDLKRLVNVVDNKKDILINRRADGSATLRIPSDMDTDVIIAILQALGFSSDETGIELV